ncbi:transposase and inactivated derivatives-like protein [Candidatus Vecturithrix granuli]|uniref:Transposase and inactivated derivatives-like protein n=1 Tax=Vecturithrix granuli TaxID=1499967 RepID=A0A081C1X9_VECG1|nr:transposase and inactivated derivatives-like protein [Candidatus Vecturithrix granuli]
MKPISEDLRQRIVAVYEEGQWSYSQVAERFRMSVRSVIRFVKQYREIGSVLPKPPSNGSQPTMNATDIQYLKDTLASHPDVPQDELKELLRMATGTQVSQSTASCHRRDFLEGLRYKGCEEVWLPTVTFRGRALFTQVMPVVSHLPFNIGSIVQEKC